MDAQPLKPLHDVIHRYAGWLARDRVSVMVRADVEALGIAIDACADATPSLKSLDANLARLPNSEVKKMLRAASRKLRRTLTAVDESRV